MAIYVTLNKLCLHENRKIETNEKLSEVDTLRSRWMIP